MKQDVGALAQSFGGLKVLADAVMESYAVVYGWKRRGSIPAWRLPKIATAISRRRIWHKVTPAWCDALGKRP